MNVFAPGSIDGIREVVRGHERIVVRGAGTKQMFGEEPPTAPVLDLRNMSGILEYDPGEFTFTALAGTPLREIEKALCLNGQHLPCDLPWSKAEPLWAALSRPGLTVPAAFAMAAGAILFPG